MEVVHPRCAGIDIGKRGLTACRITPGPDGQAVKEIRNFGTLTRELLALADWLDEASVTTVAMESTGSYWKPIYNVLEDRFELLLANAAHLKAVPGRKTDVRDAEWIADLLRHGLLRPSFVPSRPERELRELTRYRTTLVRERAGEINRIEKILEGANIKLGSVISGLDGVSGRAMLEALVAGETDPTAIAGLADRRLRAKEEALERVEPAFERGLDRLAGRPELRHLAELDALIATVSGEVEARLRPFDEDLANLVTTPGVGRRTAEIALAELGGDMTRFRSARQLASWASLCPGNHESAGKRLAGTTRKGNTALRSALVTAAAAAARTSSYLGAQYRRIAARRGARRAKVAVAHSLLLIIRAILITKRPYRDLGPNYFDERDRDQVRRRLTHRLEALGYAVSLVPATA